MYETSEDLERLQSLLDESYAHAGPHLRDVIGPERRLDAAALTGKLTGMCLLVLATVSADCRPIAGPVDGIFYRGSFYFGSSPQSVRFRHIRARPSVSATHLPGEELSVTVHGDAEEIDLRAEEHQRFRRALLDVYVPRYGPHYEVFIDSGPVHARIHARRMLTFWMPEPFELPDF